MDLAKTVLGDEIVVAGAAPQNVVSGIAIDIVVVVGADDVLETEDRLDVGGVEAVAVGVLEDDRLLVVEIDGDAAMAPLVGENVVAFAAVQLVDAGASVQRVVALVAPEGIVAAAALQHVVGLVAFEAVAATLAA